MPWARWAVVFAAIALIVIVIIFIADSYNDCADHGGVLLRGAIGFVCVT